MSVLVCLASLSRALPCNIGSKMGVLVGLAGGGGVLGGGSWVDVGREMVVLFTASGRLAIQV